MKKILICGDSFAVDYSDVSTNAGWANLLCNDFLVTNCAQAGASEYRILNQIKNSKINSFDAVIVSHTSPNRLYIGQHPVHNNKKKHANCDLIYSDLEYHLKLDPNNRVVSSAVQYFENIFDQQYHEDIYCLITKEIQRLAQSKPCLHLFTLFDKNCKDFEHHLNLKNRFEIVPGQTNHYTVSTNFEIYRLITQWMNLVS